ncbi:CapA family protein [Yinghuangia aomiensis]
MLANNHVLDFGRAGPLETLDVLHGAGLRTVGAGRTRAKPRSPRCSAPPRARVVVAAFGMPFERRAGRLGRGRAHGGGGLPGRCLGGVGRSRAGTGRAGRRSRRTSWSSSIRTGRRTGATTSTAR